MSFELFVFYVFAAILVFAASRVITVRNPVFAAMFLVLTFFTCAGIWMLLEAEFLAITLVLVYVGAVMVLFLFVIMMLDVKREEQRESFGKYLPVGLTVAAVIAVEMILVLSRSNFSDPKTYTPQQLGANDSNTERLGELLYTEYLYPFEIAGVILLVAIIAAIILTLRTRADSKSQDIEQQVRTKRADRVRIVQMEAEK